MFIDLKKPISTYLEACEAALLLAKRPMSSKELAGFIETDVDFEVGGLTPWKTINARLSAEILENSLKSTFVRVDSGKFAIRKWPDAVEYVVAKRKINPINELIAVVPTDGFLEQLVKRPNSKFFDVDYVELFKNSQPMPRVDAEETDKFVQLIPLFFVHSEEGYLTYKRTKRLPEKRLHGTRSINFGGHLQVEDFPSLFANDPDVVQESLQRELREELKFEPDEKTVRFFGAIHDRANMFGRQHIGLVFEVISGSTVDVDTNEPGFLTSIEFASKQQIFEEKDQFDDWTFLVLDEHKINV
ncbi:MAG: hypothetical protein GQ535_08755 [Rhodobacteraceae bacterium]|nr:hypothetical protein [Paracoccaceae bacterium]